MATTPRSNETASDIVDNVEADKFAALEALVADMQAKLAAAEAKDKAATAALPVSNAEDITIENPVAVEDTFIVYRQHYEEKGVQMTKDYRMKTSEFEAICAERGW